MLPDLAQSTLLVIDIQERLFPAMATEDQERLVKATANLIEAVTDFGGNVVFSEQYPRGLGATIPELSPKLGSAERLEKVAFSVCAATDFPRFERLLKKNVILVGMEAHICVLLSGLDLLKEGRRVWVPLDAVASRRVEDKANALDLLTRAGATVVNSESLVFNQLGVAGTEAFKKFARLIR